MQRSLISMTDTACLTLEASPSFYQNPLQNASSWAPPSSESGTNLGHFFGLPVPGAESREQTHSAPLPGSYGSPPIETWSSNVANLDHSLNHPRASSSGPAYVCNDTYPLPSTYPSSHFQSDILYSSQARWVSPTVEIVSHSSPGSVQLDGAQRSFSPVPDMGSTPAYVAREPSSSRASTIVPPYPTDGFPTDNSMSNSPWMTKNEGSGAPTHKSPLPYAKLIHRALMSSPNHQMALRDIYAWFKQHTDKAENASSKGWQNSIRHNLSMNEAFEKVELDNSSGESHRTFAWRLAPEAAMSGRVESTTKFRKPGTPKRSATQSKTTPARASAGKSSRPIRKARRRNRNADFALTAAFDTAVVALNQNLLQWPSERCLAVKQASASTEVFDSVEMLSSQSPMRDAGHFALERAIAATSAWDTDYLANVAASEVEIVATELNSWFLGREVAIMAQMDAK